MSVVLTDLFLKQRHHANELPCCNRVS